MRADLLCVLVVVGAAAIASPALAQDRGNRPAASVEFGAGYAGFIDDAMIDHGLLAVAARVYLSPRVSIGPELTYMIGPGHDRDLFVTGNLTVDLLRGRPGRRAPVIPFVVAGGGLFRHSDRFGSSTFASTEGAFTAGGGARIQVSDRIYIAPEFRIGWEPHYRVAAAVGIKL